MKILKKASVLALAALTVCSATACGGGKGGEKVDPNKTQFYVGNFNGGYGHAWIDKAADAFEKRFENKSFEEGKTGVQIWIVNGKDEFNDWNFVTKIDTREEDVYVGATNRQEILDGNKVLTLNDIIDEPLTEFGETRTIREKLSPYYKEAHYLNDQTTKVQYLPYSEAFFGNWSYDMDLFEEKGFYLTESGSWTTGENKSKGLDGVAGTYDDGLPRTEAEFWKLLNYIKNKSVTPATWTGQYDAYTTAWGLNLFLNYDDGVGQKMYNTGYGSWTSKDGKTTIELDGTGFDFYKIFSHPGKLAALEAMYKLVNTPRWYSSEAFKTSQTHIEAQDEFVTSVMADTRIAMILEGTWWENEASDTFKRMSKYNTKTEKFGRYDRNFGIMPTFRFEEGTAKKTNYLASNQVLMINANTDHEDLSKLFIKYLLSDEVRELFTKETGCPSPYDYQISPDTYNSLSTFGKQLWDIHENEHGAINFVTEHVNVNPARLYNMSKYPYGYMSNLKDPKSTVGPETSPFSFFKFDTEGYSAEDYFQGMITYANLAYDEYYAGEQVTLRDGSKITLPERQK